MKKVLFLALVAVLASFGLGYAFAAPKTYQVTGPVLDVTADTVTVQKGSEKWEIARNASTKVTGELKAGAKVTIQYTMTATDIEVKSGTTTKTKKK